MKRHFRFYMAVCVTVLFLGMAAQADALELGARAYLWYPDLKTADVTSGLNSSNIDMRDMLGIGNKVTYAVEAYGGVGRHHVSLSYTPFGYSDDRVLSANLNFNGITYNANTSVRSDLDFSMFDLKYQYDLLNMENLLAGFSVGAMAQIKYSTGNFKMTAAGVGRDQKKSFDSVIPMVGLGAHVGLVANLLEARAQVTGGGYNSGDYAIEALADISLTPFPFLDIHGGYKIVKLKMDVKDYAMDSFFTGPYIALTVGF